MANLGSVVNDDALRLTIADCEEEDAVAAVPNTDRIAVSVNIGHPRDRTAPEC